MISVQIRGLDRVFTGLSRLESSRDVLERAGIDAARHVMDSIPSYPPPSRKPMQFVSERQRRYVMMLVSQGRVPYRRTGQLAGGFNTQARVVGNEVAFSIANDVAYAPFVIDERRQARYHRGHWWTIQVVAKRVQARVVQIFRDHVTRALTLGR